MLKENALKHTGDTALLLSAEDVPPIYEYNGGGTLAVSAHL